MENTASVVVPRGRLALSRAPVAELAAAAIRAQQATKREPGDVEFVVIAVPRGADLELVADTLDAALASLQA